MRFLGTESVRTAHDYKVNGVDFRFDIITSLYDVIPPGALGHTWTGFSLDCFILSFVTANICPMI